MTASAIELSVCSGVGGCLCPISSKMILMYTASLAMIHKAANSASVAADMTCFIMWDMLRTSPLFCGMVESLDNKKMASCTAACFRFAQLSGLAVCRQFHVTFIECEDSFFLCFNVIKKLLGLSHCVFCWCR